MDDLRFDRFAKSLVSPSTRRSAIAGLAAGFLGLAGLRSGSAATCRATGVTCSKNAECCGGFCGSKDARGRRTCGCPAGQKPCNGRCVEQRTCCDDFDCSQDHSCLNGGCFRNTGDCELGCGECSSAFTTEGDIACAGPYYQETYPECTSTDNCPTGFICGGDIDNGNGGSYCFIPCEFAQGEATIAC